MVATLVNGLAVIVGGFIGLLFRKSIKKAIFDAVLKVVGIVVFIIGLGGVFQELLVIDGTSFQTQNELLLLVSLSLGTFLGELFHIDDHLNNFGLFLEKKMNKGKFSEGFISSSIIFCIGAMALVGSIKAALGDSSIIYLKAMIDGITAIVLASTLGFGVLFSAISLVLYQGFITMLGMIFGDFLPLGLVSAFSMVGFAIVACIGLNFFRTEKLKLANMLPSLVIAILFFLFQQLF
jgi:uncharacterized membrane protein YqgA involved in biofilm formation